MALAVITSHPFLIRKLVPVTTDVRVGRSDDFFHIPITALPQQMFPITDSFHSACMNCTVTLAAAEYWRWELMRIWETLSLRPPCMMMPVFVFQPIELACDISRNPRRRTHSGNTQQKARLRMFIWTLSIFWSLQHEKYRVSEVGSIPFFKVERIWRNSFRVKSPGIFNRLTPNDPYMGLPHR